MAVDALPLDAELSRRWQRTAVLFGGAGLALVAIGWLVDRPAAVRSYLWAYIDWLGVALGSLALTMLHYLTGGVWGLILRRILEAAARTLPLMTLLFLPIALCVPDLYAWANPDIVAHDEVLLHKQWYLDVGFFLSRAAAYFIIWNLLALILLRWSLAQDSANPPTPQPLRRLAAGGMLLYAVTITFASIDWVMSLEPHWYSTIFGPLFGVGQLLSALSFGTVVLLLLADRPPLAGLLGRPHFRDLGSLLLAFVMFWAYLGFSQYLLIWSGNLPPENPYYLRRTQGGWQYLAVLILLGHFILPFVLLLSGDVKRTRSKLLAVAAMLLVMRAIDLYWMIAPAPPFVGETGAVSFSQAFSWLDLAAPVGVGGVWLAAFLGQLQRRPILPNYDPLLAEAQHHE